MNPNREMNLLSAEDSKGLSPPPAGQCGRRRARLLAYRRGNSAATELRPGNRRANPAWLSTHATQANFGTSNASSGVQPWSARRNACFDPGELAAVKKNRQPHCFSTLDHNLAYCYKVSRTFKWTMKQALHGFPGTTGSLED